ncbi:STP1 protein [Plasmodium malariae]|uniref:STP1 protein n=1 Tax=Plasmodium malariae TaxID=5858 RepID=A0A1D3JHJ9_PLAMA|nr:STP1 protein [Plasmodium malariae]SBT85811.1 STP1 protein [Plasmodium malariae]
MDSCFSSYVPIFGYDAWRLRTKPEFKKIITHVQEKTNSLKNEKNKQVFRRVCLELADYLIKKKKESPPYEREDKWELALKYWLQQYYKGLNKYGICPMILNEDDKKVLDFIYEAEDFCSEKKGKKPNCINTDERSNKKCDSACLSKIQAYNAWVKNRKVYFKNNKDLINRKCKNINSLLPFPKRSCDVLNDKTFEEIPQCEASDPPVLKQTVKNEEEESATEQDLTKAKDESSQIFPINNEQKNEGQRPPASEHEEQLQKSFSSSPNMKNKDDVSEPVQTETSSVLTEPKILPPEIPPEALSTTSGTAIAESPHFQGTIPSSPEDSEPVSTTFERHSLYKPLGLLKKKKSIKRRQVKLLRILKPSHSNRKKKILTHDHPENTIYDEEQIIKKLKIHEHDMIKNIKSSKQKKDRFKTIIEVHMEVLEEFRNEEWEHKKGEFLELCLEVFAEEEYRTYPNLSNGELIMENTKSINDIEKQKILYNKWIKEHRNISEKLKKTVWFKYLKNEWKKEKASIKETEELKMNVSIEIQKISFSEKEKDLWREWISKNRMIIDRFLEKEWDEVLTQELLNMIDECVNEELKNNISLLNTKEVQQKVSYEELYKYIKKKLLAKLCILVFMMVLEECKKEDFIENEGLHLDSYINDWTTEVNLGRKSELTKEIIEFNGNVLENTENTKIPAYTGEEGLRQVIEKWVRVQDTPENSIYNENIVE